MDIPKGQGENGDSRLGVASPLLGYQDDVRC
jgi:hypothetical protein